MVDMHCERALLSALHSDVLSMGLVSDHSLSYWQDQSKQKTKDWAI